MESRKCRARNASSGSWFSGKEAGISGRVSYTEKTHCHN